MCTWGLTLGVVPFDTWACSAQKEYHSCELPLSAAFGLDIRQALLHRTVRAEDEKQPVPRSIAVRRRAAALVRWLLCAPHALQGRELTRWMQPDQLAPAAVALSTIVYSW